MDLLFVLRMKYIVLLNNVHFETAKSVNFRQGKRIIVFYEHVINIELFVLNWISLLNSKIHTHTQKKTIPRPKSCVFQSYDTFVLLPS